MTLTEALDLIVVQSGHAHYRTLCDEDNPDREQRDGYRRLIMRLAEDGPLAVIVQSPDLIAPTPRPVDESIRLARLAATCPYRSNFPACGCCGSRCGLTQAIKTRAACWKCVETYPI